MGLMNVAAVLEWLAIVLLFAAFIAILRRARQPLCDRCYRCHEPLDVAAPMSEAAPVGEIELLDDSVTPTAARSLFSRLLPRSYRLLRVTRGS